MAGINIPPMPAREFFKAIFISLGTPPNARNLFNDLSINQTLERLANETGIVHFKYWVIEMQNSNKTPKSGFYRDTILRDNLPDFNKFMDDSGGPGVGLFWQQLSQKYPNGMSLNYTAVEQEKGGIAGVVQDIGPMMQELIDKAKEFVSVALLAPFKVAMKKELQRKGEQVGNDLKDISKKFYSKVIKKEQFEKIEPATMTMIINTILNFFKNLLMNSGNLSNNEKAMKSDAMVGMENADALIAAESKKESDFSEVGKWILLGIGALIVLKLMKII